MWKKVFPVLVAFKFQKLHTCNFLSVISHALNYIMFCTNMQKNLAKMTFPSITLFNSSIRNIHNGKQRNYSGFMVKRVRKHKPSNY